jgi:branched-chain amino acid transport system ATP-binding protein
LRLISGRKVLVFKTNKLNIAYGDIHIVHEVSFQIEKKEVVCLVGSNGAGKTTIMKTISGLLRPLSGDIVFDGVHLEHLQPDEIVDLGISQVPEGRKLFGPLSVEINLEMGAIRKQARKHMQANMDRVFGLFPVLAQRKKQVAESLSGGEQQMVAIARSLMSDPKLLLMDEPSLGLAPFLVNIIFNTVVEIKQEGTTILLVEQNLVEALKISDRAYILETGKIVRAGGGQQLLNDEEVKRDYLGI